MDEQLWTREVWRARKKRKSYALSSSSFLSALQISQVHHIAKKNTSIGWLQRRHNSLVS